MTRRPLNVKRLAGYSLLAIAAGVLLARWQWDFLRGYARAPSLELLAMQAKAPSTDVIGLIRFTYDDLGSLNTDALQTHATPWKVVSTALLQHSDTEELTFERLNALLREFGFVVPDTIANWRGNVPPEPFRRPIGILTSQLRRSVPQMEIETANIGCAACHAGVTYDADGNATRDIWLGLPNTSLNLEAFTSNVYESLKAALPGRDRLIAGIRTLYPEVSEREIATIEGVLLPRIDERLQELEATLGRAIPYSNGFPGTTNGVGALKWTMGLLREDATEREVSFTSIPDLGGTLLRTSLLYDGTYSVPGMPRFARMELSGVTENHARALAEIVTFFTVPAMGTTPATAEEHIPQAVQILDFVRAYEPPPFPGPIDPARAARGREIYQAQCAQCHGEYSAGLQSVRLVSFPNRHVPQAEMNTDSARWQPDSSLIPVLRKTEFGKHMDAASTGGYVATPLTALWATAPYLHNGSVPTLWHLMHPDLRPDRFYVGGHRLNFETVGIDGALDADGVYRYREGYEPWSTPALYDATRPGLRNLGHEREFGSLTEEEKRALLEYLKLL